MWCIISSHNLSDLDNALDNLETSTEWRFELRRASFLWVPLVTQFSAEEKGSADSAEPADSYGRAIFIICSFLVRQHGDILQFGDQIQKGLF